MTKLKDITGKALSGEWGTDDETGVGIPVLRTTNFTNEGIVNYENVVTRIITKKDISEKYLQSGDIIIEKSGGSDKQPVGRVIYFDGPENTYLFNNFTGLLRVRDKNEWFPRYVFYSLFANYKKGGTRPFENKTTGLHNLKTDDYVSRYEITEIPLNKQVAICAQLDQILKVINLRRKELSNLDDLIKARFIELFGDPQRNPHGYKHTKLSDIATYYNGLTYKPENVATEGTIVLRSSNIQNSQLDFADTVRVDCAIKERLMVQKNDILMCSRNGSAKLVGKVALIKDIQEPMSFGAFMMIIRSHYFGYLMTYFQMDAFRQQIKTGATTTINQITGRMLDDVTIPLPPMSLVDQFATFVEQIDKSKLLSGCRLFHSWAPENRDKPKHVGVPQRKTKVLRGGRRQQ